MTSSPTAGLRERKKARTRAAIRDHAMRLFEEQGFAATTVDQIAAAAEVSQSTFFRYFPTKEDVVLSDDYDPLMLAAVRDQPPDVPPIEAIRRGIRTVFEQISPEDWVREQDRQRMIFNVPELRAKATQKYAELIGMMAAVIAERAGRPAGDLRARVLAGAVLGALLAVAPGGTIERGDIARLDEALGFLQDGLPL